MSARQVDTWIFDLDNTLYSTSTRIFDQIDARMKAFIARELGLGLDDAFALQKKYFHAHGTTLRGLMLNHSVDPEAFLNFVHDIDHSTLQPDARLGKAIERLPGRKIVFTNATAYHAERVTERLGIARHMSAIFDIRAARYMPKPHQQPYGDLIAAHGIDPGRAAMFEDSSANLKPAADLGMATVWVRNGISVHRESSDNSHCHHVIENLALWLETAGQKIADKSIASGPR